MASMQRTTIAAAGVLMFAGLLFAQTPPAGDTALLDPNTASQTELTAVPHITPAIAKDIVAKRPFKTNSDLDTVLRAHKLTPDQLKEVYGKMFVRLDLNTATDEQILMIPGIGKRMLHEFKEYRPYKSMAQFRREIGKYVSKEEVARFERYVTIQ
jgi:DNA uptake protein ComE-like DNA-binding protein